MAQTESACNQPIQLSPQAKHSLPDVLKTRTKTYWRGKATVFLSGSHPQIKVYKLNTVTKECPSAMSACLPQMEGLIIFSTSVCLRTTFEIRDACHATFSLCTHL